MTPNLNEVLWVSRWVDLTMLQFYAHVFVGLMEDLRRFEQEVDSWRFKQALKTPEGQSGARQILQTILGSAAEGCKTLSLSSASKQIINIGEQLGQGVNTSTLASLLAELQKRIAEDFQDKIFYSVTDGVVVERFFRRSNPAIDDPELPVGALLLKRADELFDPSIVTGFPETGDDIEAAGRCFAFDENTACVFHLMRVVEHGLRRLARLVDIEDPKPSWGAILQKLEKYALRTEYKDLPPVVQRHREFIREVLPRMQGIQHAWRNKVDHVGDKLVPIQQIDPKTASEIMTATEAFMRMLAREFPT